MTDPQDWTLFKKPEDQGGLITAFLDDSGCQRIAPLWGIDVTPEGNRDSFHVEQLNVGDDYLITISGDAFCHTTGATIRGIEGCRGSDEDFVKHVTGTRKLSYVRKAAFANLSGGCVRKITGLSSLPLSELERVWKPLGKNWQHCNKGRGFGAAEKRFGTGETGTEPKCPKCNGPMKLIKPKPGATWQAFWGCGQGKDKCKGSVQDADWQKAVAARKAAEPDTEAVAAPAEEAQREPGDAPAEPNGKPPGDDTEQAIGKMKYRLQQRIAGKPWQKEILAMVLKAKTLDDLVDLETVIIDREKGGA
jgi:hypothetical protein